MNLFDLLTPKTDKPSEDPEAVGDPYKTLFIARLVNIALTLFALNYFANLVDCVHL